MKLAPGKSCFSSLRPNDILSWITALWDIHSMNVRKGLSSTHYIVNVPISLEFFPNP